MPHNVTILNKDWDKKAEIRSLIANSKATFDEMSRLLKSHDLRITTEMRIIKCYIFTILLYRVESWTQRKIHEDFGSFKNVDLKKNVTNIMDRESEEWTEIVRNGQKE